MELNNLYNRTDNLDLCDILSALGYHRAEKQNHAEETAFFCPFCGGTTPHFIITDVRRGGLYAAQEWRCMATGRHGYGAISMVGEITTLDYQGKDRIEVMRRVWATQKADKCTIPAEVQKDYELRNGTATWVSPQTDTTLKLREDFTPEALQFLSCQVERLYEGSEIINPIQGGVDRRKALPVRKSREYVDAVTGTRQPLFKYSFGPAFSKNNHAEPNWNPQDLHREFHLYQVESYISKAVWSEGRMVSIMRTATDFFPIFALVYEETVKTDNGQTKTLQWGQIIQPEWNPAKSEHPSFTQNFYFYNGGLNKRSVNRELMGDAVCHLALSGLDIPAAVKQVQSDEPLETTKEIPFDDPDQPDVHTSETPIPPDEVKLYNLVLCKDALNAIAVYYHLNVVRLDHSYDKNLATEFYHVMWQRDYAKDFSSFMHTRLSRLTNEKYILFDIDNVGKKKSFQICKRFTKFRIAFLPERLKEMPLQREGGVFHSCTDARSFFRAYEMTSDELFSFEHDKNLFFLSIFTSSLPIEPLVKVEKRDKKTDELTDYYYKLDSACLWLFMATEGYCREVDHESSDAVGRYLRIDGPFVRELDPKSLLAATTTTLTEFAQRTARAGSEDFRKMSNAIITTRDINEKTAVNLPEMEIDYRSGYGPKLDHFFYRNGALRITPTSITFHKYEELNFNVDRAEILPFDFIMPCAAGDEPFSIHENPEYAERTATLEDHRKDIQNYTQKQIEMEEQELQRWCQTNRWLFDFHNRPVNEWWQPLQVLRCFANENYEREEELQREGKEFSDEEYKLLMGHLANIIYSFGRPLFRYRGGGTNYMPYITENNVSEEGKSEGGSGKSVFVNIFMACAGKVLRINGRNLKPDTDINLELANYIPHGHRVIHWEDYAKGMPIDPLFNFITSGFQYRQRHKDEHRILLKDSPGHVATSNFQQTYADPSASGRVVPTGFSHRFNRGDTKKNKPARKISTVMPGLKDDPEDMDITLRSQIAYICALAVQFCMNCGDRVLGPMDDLNKRSQETELGATFISWATTFFAKPFVYNVPIDFDTIFDEYKEMCDSSDDTKTKFSGKVFRDKIVNYCSDINVLVNPDAVYSSESDRKKTWVRRNAWVMHTYFYEKNSRVQAWPKEKRKDIREMTLSTRCLVFVKKGEENRSTEEFAAIYKQYALQPDPDPVLDIDGNPVKLTEEEQTEWQMYLNRRQGKSGASAANAVPDVTLDPAQKPGEVKPELDLPF